LQLDDTGFHHENANMKLLTLLMILATPAFAAEPSLYQRLGGKPGMQSLAGDTVEKLAGDSRLLDNAELKHLSESVDRKKLKEALAQRLCQKSGGPCKRKAAPIAGVPEHLTLKPLEWIYVIQDVNSVLDQHHTPVRERTELLNLLLTAKEQAGPGPK
jgi:hemoglobin